MVGAKVVRIERGDITSLVRMDSATPLKLTSIISNEAVDELGLHEGDQVEAIIESTEVIIAKTFPLPNKARTKKSRHTE